MPAGERFETATALLAAALTGVVVGITGTAVHRVQAGGVPAGVAAAILLVAVGAVFARSLDGRLTCVVFGVAALATLAVVLTVRPGDDRILLLDPLGWAWITGAAVAVLAVFLAPGGWFGEARRPPPRHGDGANLTVEDPTPPAPAPGAPSIIADGEWPRVPPPRGEA